MAIAPSARSHVRLIAEKRVRGKYSMPPENLLQSLLRVILRNFAANTKGVQRSLSRIVINDISLAEFVADAHSAADAKLEARETLKAVPLLFQKASSVRRCTHAREAQVPRNTQRSLHGGPLRKLSAVKVPLWYPDLVVAFQRSNAETGARKSPAFFEE